MSHIDDWETLVLDDQFMLRVDERATSAYNDQRERVITHVNKHWWLFKDDQPVAFLHTLFHTGDEARHGGCPLVLCDIEVRPEHRGQGYTRRIVAEVEKVEGHQVWTSGGFTPLGAQALSWLPVYPWERDPGVKYNDMTFIEDWDTLRASNPL